MQRVSKPWGGLSAAAIALMLLSNVASAADVWPVKNTHIRNSPSFSSKKLAPVNQGEKLDAVSRKGGWVKVKKQATEGWVRSYEVRTSQLSINTTDGEAKPGLSNSIQTLSRSTSSLFGTRASQSTQKSVVATLGVRGLSEEELSKAKPDVKALDGLEAFQASDKQAKSFAKAGDLQPIRIKYIKVKK